MERGNHARQQKITFRRHATRMEETWKSFVIADVFQFL